MKKVLLILLSITLTIAVKKSYSQSWVEKMQDPSVNFYEVKKSFNTYFDEQKQKELKREQQNEQKERNENREQEQKNKKSNPNKIVAKTNLEKESREVPNFEIYKRWENYMEARLYPSGDRSVMINGWNDYLNGFYSNAKSPANETKAAQATSWSIIGPTTTIPSSGGAGRLNFIHFDPTNSATVYVGSPAGGLWKSTTGGNSWTTNTDNLAVIGCSDLEINPNNTQIMYLATGDGEAGDTYSIGVLKSTNGGTSWNPTGLNWLVTSGRTISKLLINPQNPNTLFAATSIGLYRTLNAGSTWTQIATASGNLKDIEYKPGDTTTLYTCSTTLFYKSINGGTSFASLSSSTGLPVSTAVARLAIGVTANDPTYVYVVAAIAGTGSANDYGFQGLYLSTNSGGTFTSKSTTPNLLGYNSNGGDQGGQGWYTLSIAVSPTNKAEVLVGGVNIWRSTSSGASWSLNAQWTGSGAPYVHADIHALEYLPGSGTTCFAGCDGGFFKTTNNGTAWSDLSNGLQISEAYKIGLSATNSNLLLAGLQDNGTIRNSGTTSWTRPLGGDGMECLVDWSNENIQYGELYYGDINKTTTGGNLNTNIVSTGGTGVNSTGDWVTPFIEAPSNAATLFVGKDQVYKSTNSGTNWTTVGSVTGGTGSIIALANAASNINYIYAAKTDKFYVSTNGTSFTDRTVGLPVANAAITYIAVHPTDPNRVWVTFSGYSSANKVWYSADAGVTWTNYSTGLPNLPANCIVYQNGSANEILYIGTDVGVYVRDNTASSWSSYFVGLPNVIVRELEIQYTVSKLRAATFGRGIWQTDLYVSATALPAADFSANRTNICEGNNIAYADLTNGTPIAWSWSFPGGTPSTSTSQNPIVTYNTAGTYNAQLIVTNANGKDTMLKTGYIVVSGPIALPLVEGYQGVTFAPTGWAINNPDGDITWAQTATAGGFGTSTSSVLFDNYSPPNTTAGTIDDMITPKYTFTGLSTAKLKFDVAYCRLNNTLWDSLIILASTDCGSTWSRVYAKGGTGLATAPDKSGSGIFVPSAAQWRTDSVNLAAYIGQADVMFNFQSISGWGQALYLDNINIYGSGVPASVIISETTGSNTACSGSLVTFTATPSNGGATPSYQWKVNGINAGTNSATFTTSSLTNGQIITCEMTSNLIGVTGNPSLSNSITMTINTNPSSPVVIVTNSCANSVLSTTATGTLLWSTGESTPSITVTSPGIITVTQTVNGCISAEGSETSAPLTVPNAPLVTSPVNYCQYDNVVALSAIGSNLLWYTVSSGGAGSPTTPTVSTTLAGLTNYYVSQRVLGCESPRATIAITVIGLPITPNISQNGAILTSSATIGNQWYLDNNIISGDTNQTYSVTQNGTYSVVVTSYGCASNASASLNILNTSISEINNAEQIFIYPNPSDGCFTISFNADSKSTYKIELKNTLGQLIYSDEITNYNGNYSKSISIRGFGKGVYTIHLLKDTKDTIKKIVIY